MFYKIGFEINSTGLVRSAGLEFFIYMIDI